MNKESNQTDMQKQNESSSGCTNTSCCPPSLKPIVRTGPKIGRNDPCVCGSNLKFKKCCGKN